MELHEAFAALLREETGPVARAAHDSIRAYALRAARAHWPRATADHEDCAQDVTVKLWKRLSMGDCPVRQLSHAACAAYVRTMADNWMIDRQRRDRTRAQYGERLRRELDSGPSNDAEHRAVQTEEDVESSERRARARALLDRLALISIDHRQPRHRVHLEQGWREIRAMVFESIPLDSLLLEGGAIEAGADRESWVRARNAAYKRHQRTREALEESLEALARAGELADDEIEVARLGVAALARCQRSARPSVDEERS